jgi:hypothetical protein
MPNGGSTAVRASSGYSWGKLTAVVFGNPQWWVPYNSVCPGTGADGSSWSGMAYRYSYAQSGRVTGKRVAISRIGHNGGISTANLDTAWTYDNEGRPLTMTYPVVNDPSTNTPTSTAFNYTYDAMGRAATMSPGPNLATW